MLVKRKPSMLYPAAWMEIHHPDAGEHGKEREEKRKVRISDWQMARSNFPA
jgi:hypothetical protein